METFLLQTKLFIPPFRQSHILRPRLIDKLSETRSYKLILLSAPAGYGKTTLATEWIEQLAPNTAVHWLSLDEDDNDSQRFFNYLAAAIRPLTGTQTTLAQQLQAPQPLPAKNLMAAFVNDIATAPPFYFILDDYHVIDTAEIDEAVAFLLDYAPPQMTLVIASRTDPSFPISRLRARGQLLELRASDLHFTDDETAAFLQQTMNLTLTTEQIAALKSRTEGWIAGLQMAALSMQNRSDVDGFIDSFTGSHRFIMDYLLEEVLNQQPAETQKFLLETAVLDRFCTELCDAVRQATNSQLILHQLDTENLFLIPLDNERRWYRYHHLFAEILQQRLHHTTAAPTTADLHGRASQWYEDNDLEIEAFHHAAAAGDTDRAVRLMDGNGVPLYLRGGGTPVFNWLASLPSDELNQRPSLLLSYASALTYVGKIHEAEQYIRTAESILIAKPELDAQERDLLGQIYALEAMKAISHNDFEAIIVHAEKAWNNLLPDNETARTTAAWAMGYAHQVQGNRSAALQAYNDVIAISQKTDNEIFLMGATTGVGQIKEADNDFFTAAEAYQEVLHLAGDPPAPPACEGHRGLAQIYYEWNQLDKAAEHAQRGYEIAITIDGIDTPATCQRIWARVLLAQGDAAGAAKLLAEGEQFIHQHQFDHELPNQAAAQIRLLLHQNKLTPAAELANQYDIPISQARVHLAQGNPTAALHLLAPHRQMAEAKQWA